MPRRRAPFLIVLFLLAGVFALSGRTEQAAPAGKAAGGNVRDWGAKADGSDDWQAIQNAVNGSVGAVHFPPGTYRITKPVVIDLDRVGPVAITGSAARVVMAGEGPAFHFVGTHAGTADPGTVKDNVWERQRRPTLDGIEIVGGHVAASGVRATGTMQLTITRALVRRCLHGIHLTGRNRNVVISDCHLYENAGIGVFLDRVNLHSTLR